MSKPARPSLQLHILPVFATLLALAITLLLQQWMQMGYSLLFLAAVMISARYGGLWAGLIATLLAMASLSFFFLKPVYSLWVSEFTGLAWLGTFVSVSFLISSLNESRKRAEERLRLANRELETEVANRTADLTASNEELKTEIAERKKIAAERESLIRELQSALDKINVLSGLLPICPHCKKIRDGKGAWNQLESYLSEHSEATFSSVTCPECAKTLYPNYPFINR